MITENELRQLEERWFPARLKHVRQLDSIVGHDKYTQFPSEVSIIYFVEIKNTFVYEAYVACIVLCQLLCAEVLKAPFSLEIDTENTKTFTAGFSKLIDENEKIGRIPKKISKNLYKLKKIRDNFEHTKQPRKIICDLEMGNQRLAELYSIKNYGSLESEALFGIKLVIWLLEYVVPLPYDKKFDDS